MSSCFGEDFFLNLFITINTNIFDKPAQHDTNNIDTANPVAFLPSLLSN